MKNKKLLIAILALVLLLGAAGIGYRYLAPQLDMESLQTTPAETETQPDSSQATEAAGKLDTDFTVYDRQGNKVKLSDFLDKPIVVNFWSSNCGPCKSEMPEFQEAFETYGNEIHFLMVNVTNGYWDTKETAEAFVDKQGYTFPVFLDLDRDASGRYGVYSLPRRWLPPPIYP